MALKQFEFHSIMAKVLSTRVWILVIFYQIEASDNKWIYAVYIPLVIFERKKFPLPNDLTFFFVFSRRIKWCPAWTGTSQGRCGLCRLCCWRWRHPWLCHWSLAALYRKDPRVRTPYPDHPGWEQSGLSRIQVNNFQKVPFCLQFV